MQFTSGDSMRIATVLSLAIIASSIPMARAQAQVGVSVGLNLGNVRTVAAYSSAQHGDWQTSYKQWQPTTLYSVNGQYYDKKSAGSRAVVVYHHNDQYFMPPQDKKWVGKDKRYDYKHKPTSDDYNRSK
jgi:hypothetical protein